jgi:hypothetical protein
MSAMISSVIKRAIRICTTAHIAHRKRSARKGEKGSKTKKRQQRSQSKERIYVLHVSSFFSLPDQLFTSSAGQQQSPLV